MAAEMPLASANRNGSPIRIAAAGDVHVRETTRDEVAEAFIKADRDADLILLAGDLTTHGEPEQAALLARICEPLEVPVIAVLGNHDCHANRIPELVGELERGGIEVLDRSWTVRSVDGCEVGIAGTKGFIGGFPGSHLPDFGEASLRELYAEASAEIDALDEGLREVATAPYRIALLHYAPTAATLEGEPPGIWAFLGTDRLAAPILAHEPDLVMHGHAHAGTFRGEIGSVPVFNVSVHAMGRDFTIFELSAESSVPAPIH
jgi:Icc-related predicted phosphoesterase